MLFPESLSNRQPANRSTSSSSSGHDLHDLKEKAENWGTQLEDLSHPV
jgi:hypothetical protein